MCQLPKSVNCVPELLNQLSNYSVPLYCCELAVMLPYKVPPTRYDLYGVPSTTIGPKIFTRRHEEASIIPGTNDLRVRITNYTHAHPNEKHDASVGIWVPPPISHVPEAATADFIEYLISHM